MTLTPFVHINTWSRFEQGQRGGTAYPWVPSLPVARIRGCLALTQKRVLFFLWRGWKCSLAKATSLGKLLERWQPAPLPEAGWGKGGEGIVRAQGLLQLLLVYSSDVWAFSFNCVGEASLKSKRRWASSSPLHLRSLSVTWSKQQVKFPGLCLSQWGSLSSWGLLFPWLPTQLWRSLTISYVAGNRFVRQRSQNLVLCLFLIQLIRAKIQGSCQLPLKMSLD